LGLDQGLTKSFEHDLSFIGVSLFSLWLKILHLV